MGKVIAAFADYNDCLTEGVSHPLCGHGTFSIGVIQGGSIVSTVPDFCEIEVDRRILPNEKKSDVIEAYRERLDKIEAADPTFKYELSEPTWDVPSLDTPINSPVVQAVLEGYQKSTNNSPTIEAFPGGTDAPNFRCPAVICGPGSLSQAHSKNEFIEIKEIVGAVEIYLWATLKLLGQKSTSA